MSKQYTSGQLQRTLIERWRQKLQVEPDLSSVMMNQRVSHKSHNSKMWQLSIRSEPRQRGRRKECMHQSNLKFHRKQGQNTRSIRKMFQPKLHQTIWSKQALCSDRHRKWQSQAEINRWSVNQERKTTSTRQRSIETNQWNSGLSNLIPIHSRKKLI